MASAMSGRPLRQRACLPAGMSPRPAGMPRSRGPRAAVASVAAEEERELEERQASGAAAGPSSASPAAARGGLAASGKRVAVLQASKSASHPVQERQRPLAEYMTLPASQYSVLDAQRIERLDADTFRCYVGGLKIVGFEVEPVITVSVVVGERGPTVRLLSTKLQGSKRVEAANERFEATMENVVAWREAPGGAGGLELASDTSIRVALQVPPWFVLPVAAIESAGCAVMRRVLDTAVPRFLQQLGRDYEVWAAGDESRRPLEDGSLGLEGERPE